jgi:monovalent cation:proton antiporter-2 (CPA2) family protein
MTDSVLAQAFIYLAAAVIGVPLAKRAGLGSVLGYLLAGVAIGPYGLHLVGHEASHVMHFAEFGVVMMLFLVGLELKPALLWELRRPIFGLGGLQVVVTAAVAAGVGLAAGLGWKASLAVGLTLAMSSTAIVLQSLAEKSQLKTAGGQASFAVLLFQDLAVIPILAVFPLLAVAGAAATTEGGRPGWQQALLTVGSVALIVGAGRFVIAPVFRALASTRLREVFTAFALFLVVGIALLMTKVGLSPALGTFLAGVVLAESEYRHELESDIEPFKGLLLGLFFLTVGADINFSLVVQSPALIAGLVLGTMALKLGVLYALGRLFKLDRPARWLFAFALCQVGEFAFVLLQFGQSTGAFTAEVAGPLVAATALSMLLTPAAFLILDRIVLPRLSAEKEKRSHDAIAHEHNPVVMAGFGRVGQVIGRLLRTNGIGATVLDVDPAMVDLLRRLGLRVYYGDASRPELLHAAGCESAKLFVLAIDDVAKSVEVATLVRHTWPKLPIIARARNREHYYKLKALNVEFIARETMGSSLEMAIEVLKGLGYRSHTAHRLARRWREHDETALVELGKLRGQEQNVIFAAARKAMEDAERAMREEAKSTGLVSDTDMAWNNESLRAEIRSRFANNQTESQKP